MNALLSVGIGTASVKAEEQLRLSNNFRPVWPSVSSDDASVAKRIADKGRRDSGRSTSLTSGAIYPPIVNIYCELSATADHGVRFVTVRRWRRVAIQLVRSVGCLEWMVGAANLYARVRLHTWRRGCWLIRYT